MRETEKEIQREKEREGEIIDNMDNRDDKSVLICSVFDNFQINEIGGQDNTQDFAKKTFPSSRVRNCQLTAAVTVDFVTEKSLYLLPLPTICVNFLSIM